MRQNLQIKRNQHIFGTKTEAVSHMENLVDKLDDGEIVLCRYFNEGKIQTLVGFETKYEITNKETNEIQTVGAIAYVDSFNEIGNGFVRDADDIIQLNLGDGLIIDSDNKVKLLLGKGLVFTNGEVGVKVDDNIKNFLHVGDNGMSVVDMDTEVTKTTEKILVMGGPLATESVKSTFPTDNDGNPFIEESTNLQELLVKLFCQEVYPTITSDNSKGGNVSASINAPTITLSTNETTLEVGTKISATTISFNGNSKASTTSSTVSGLDYGYSLENNSIKSSANTSIVESPVTGIVTSAQTKMVCELTNFTTSKFDDISGTSVLSKSNFDLGQVKDGTNKIKISITGQPISYTINEIPSVYPCSNIGKTSGSVVTTKVNAISGTTNAPTNSNEKTITGVRYGFYGIIEDDPSVMGQETFDYNSSEIRKLTPLTSKKTFTISGDNVGRVIIAIPKAWNANIKSITDAEQMNNDLFGSSTGYPSAPQIINVEGANGYEASEYQVYTFNPSSSIKINQTVTFK